MRRSAGFVLAWVGAAVLSVAVAAAAVSNVRSNVTTVPTVLGPPTITVATDATDGATSTTTLSLVIVDTTTTTTSTTAPSVMDIPTTIPPAELTFETYDTDGGTVRIRIEGESVIFVGAQAKTGWRVEVTYIGPEEVEVEFERLDDDTEIEFLAEFEDGELVVTISEE